MLVMKRDSLTSKQSKDDEFYLKIWEVEQTVTSNRWTVTTFFISISFAIFGFSFQSQLHPSIPNLARLTALIIYWFAYVLFLRFHGYSKFLRQYLQQLEQTNKSSLQIQTQAISRLHAGPRKWVTATKMLFYFGILYIYGVIMLWGI